MRLLGLILLIFLLVQEADAAYIQTIPPVVVDNNNSSSISSKQIKRSGAKNLVDLLKTVPSLQVTQLNGEGGDATIGMRGFGDNAVGNTLILVNGQPLTNPDTEAPNLNIIPLSQIKAIKIMPISESILYGDQAVGGVINIITKSEPIREANIGYGSYNNLKGELNWGDKFKNGFNYQVFTRYLTTDNYREHNNYRDDVINGSVGYKKAQTDAYLDVQHADTHLLFPGALTAEQVKEDRRQALNTSDYGDQNINKIIAGIKQNFGQNWQFKLNGGFNDTWGNGVMTTEYDEKRQIGQLHPALVGVINAFNTSLLLHTGVDVKDSSYSYKSVSFNSDATQVMGAAYGQLKVPIAKKLALTAGARTAKARINSSTKQNNQATIGSLMLTYQFNHNWQLYARSSGSYRFPKVDESAWTLDNKPLKTQTGISYVLGSTWQTKILNIDLNVYQLDLKNEIMFVPFIDNNYFGYNENLAPTKRNGAELNLNYNITQKWKLNGGYSYINARFSSGDDKGKQIPFVAQNQFYLATYYYFTKNWYSMLDATYIGSRYPASDTENVGDKLNGYTLLNLVIA